MEKRIILLIGYKGLIGNYLYNFFLKKKYVELKLVDKKENLSLFDRSSLEKFLKNNKNIDYIINASGKNDHVIKSGDKKNYENNEILQSYIAENVIGPKNLIELSSKICKNLKSIIHFSSLYGNKSPYHPIYAKKKSVSYCISKHAMEGLTNYYATLLASKKIRINNIRVGGVKNNQPADFIRNFKKKVPINAMVPKKNLADVVNFLCSKKSEYIIGENICMDGGYGLW
jgi:NAD(P)-dependent dehydrogenase (short-subunit alcohol dehydrogenase family)